MRKLFLITAVALFFATTGAYAQDVTTGTMTDPRDGQVYPTITFGDFLLGTNVTWMAHNLNYKVSEGCWAYDNNEKYRKNLGLLYTWEVAKNVCPDGWHLPNETEWNMLVDYFGGEEKAGIALKSTQGWKDGGNGDNSSGFNALPAGCRYPSFMALGECATFWSSLHYDNTVYRRSLAYNKDKVSRNDNFRRDADDACSVRCVKD